MPVYRITPLAPAYLLLLGAALILIIGPALAPRRRHWLAVATNVLAALGLFIVGSGYPADVNLVHVLVEWLGVPALAVRVPPFEPFLWALILSLLAISLGERDIADRLSPLDQATRLALAATACGVVLAGTYRSLAYALLFFDGAAALFALTARQHKRAVGRLLLGVLSSATVIVLTQGGDYLTAHPRDLGDLFSLTVWLRLGLYPLVESRASPTSPPTMRLAWIVINLAVGLYLLSPSDARWLVWLAGTTALLHGALAWLEPGRERALAHAVHGLAGGILVVVAAVGDMTGVAAASISTLAALVALGLTPSRLGRPEPTRPQQLWAYLPPLLASVSLVGLPFTLGWEGRGALYKATWQAGVPGTLALIVVAEGAALSVLYRYWGRLLRNASAEGEQIESGLWRPLGATLVSIAFLVPVIGPRLLSTVAPSALPGLASGTIPLSTSLGLAGSLLWALFLGYGRRRLLGLIPFPRQTLMSTLRLAWLLKGLGHALDILGYILLRTRAVFEGEHYLAWAILLVLGLGLVILLR
jgi:hypothetical protein